MAGGRNDALYTVNRTTGVATRVGSATRFGVGERAPVGLAWDGSNLFMLGAAGALYRLNRSTGIATRVGSATNFGVGETAPVGLCWDGSNLFMIGLSTRTLYTLNRTTGVATSVATVTTDAVGALAFDGSLMYSTGLGSEQLYTIGRTTGIATRIGSATEFGVGEHSPGGLAWDGSRLYLGGNANDALYTLDRTTGVATRVGSAVDFGVTPGEDRPDALEWAPAPTPPPPANPTTASLSALPTNPTIGQNVRLTFSSTRGLSGTLWEFGTNKVIASGARGSVLVSSSVPRSITYNYRAFPQANLGGVGSVIASVTITWRYSNVRVTGKEFNVATPHNSPRGCGSDGTWMYVVTDDKVFVYNLATGANAPLREFSVARSQFFPAENNGTPRQAFLDGDFLYVLDAGSPEKIFVYNTQSNPLPGARDTSKEVTLDSQNKDPNGIWIDETSIYVLEEGNFLSAESKTQRNDLSLHRSVTFPLFADRINSLASSLSPAPPTM